jgi:hypothetical protein
MTITGFVKPSDEPVQVKILADTVCQPHGAVQAGQVVTVTFTEYYLLKAAGKAEKVDPAQHMPAREPSPADELSPEEFADRLDGMTKAELVAMAADKMGLQLDPKSTKDEMTTAILKAVGA